MCCLSSCAVCGWQRFIPKASLSQGSIDFQIHLQNRLASNHDRLSPAPVHLTKEHAHLTPLPPAFTHRHSDRYIHTAFCALDTCIASQRQAQRIPIDPQRFFAWVFRGASGEACKARYLQRSCAGSDSLLRSLGNVPEVCSLRSRDGWPWCHRQTQPFASQPTPT